MSETKYSAEITKVLNEGARAMAAKQYEKAVELYSEACELNNLEIGEDDPDLLYLYGWSLFENAVASSDVLGRKAADEKLEETKKEVEDEENRDKGGTDDDGSEKEEIGDDGMMQFNDKLAEDEDEEDGITSSKEDEKKDEEDMEHKLKKQEIDKEKEDGKEEESAQQSDFEIAWDILDLTRTILVKKIQDLSQENNEKLTTPYLKSDNDDALKGKPKIVFLKKKLADVYALLGDISLETDNFSQAGLDLTSMMKLRRELYPFASGGLTEGYYKLSLALEFSDLSGSIDAMKQALKTIKQRQNKGENIDKDLIQEMRQRLYDLEKGNKKIKAEKDIIMKGILGELSTTKKPKATTVVAEASSSSIKANEQKVQPLVNDLTSLVHKRKSNTIRADSKRRKHSSR
mgnify:CR=1 FL=1